MRSIEAMLSLDPEELREIMQLMGNVTPNQLSTTLPVLAKAQEVMQSNPTLRSKAQSVLKELEENRA
jgi:hypothetical protein